MKKRVLSLFMALALCLSMTPEVSYAEEAGAVTEQEAQSGESITDDTTDGDTIGNDVSGNDVSGGDADVQDAEDAAVPVVQAGGHSHPICGTECTHKDESGSAEHSAESWKALSYKGGKLMIGDTEWETTIVSGASFYILEKGNYYLEDDLTLEGVRITTSGEVNLCLNGHSITQNTVNSAIVVKSESTFSLCDCKSTVSNGSILHTETSKGFSGMSIDGTFNMYGGVISGSSDSGGVEVSSTGIFNMYGGEISGNGWGVDVKGSSNMYDGVISGNKGGQYGGGVVVGEKATFNMTGGKITKNSAQNGGGVYVSEKATFNITGGEVSGNTATYGGGVFVNGTYGDLTVSGAPKITGNTVNETENNVYLPGSNKTITIGKGGLSSDAEIGVTVATLPTKASPKSLFAMAAETVTLTSTDAKVFFVDNNTNTYSVQLIDNNLYVYYGDRHRHPICGDASCTDSSHEVDVDWTGVSELTNNMEAGYYYLTADVTVPSWTPLADIVLCLNGHSITAKTSVLAIDIVGDSTTSRTFTLTDCNGSGGKHYFRNDTDKDRWVPCKETDKDSFLVEGGVITRDANYGVQGGVRVFYGTFIMYGGTICGHGDCAGAGVCVNYSEFKMYGGAIKGNSNTSVNYGGGVCVYDSTFTMTGGTISDNKSSRGGGVYLDISSSTFNLSGGEISGNTATSSCGGVYWLSGTFNMTGTPVISGNKDVSGTADNVYVRNGAPINITGVLKEGAKIGVTPATKPMYIAKFTADMSESERESCAAKFITDESILYTSVDKDSDGAYYVAIQQENHEHYLCGGDACTETGGHSCDTKTKFTAWTSTDSLPTKSGNWYLTADVTLTSTWRPAYSVVLCLNGHSITADTENEAINLLYPGKTFTLTDCNDSKGKHYFRNDKTLDRWVPCKNGDDGSFLVEGGVITHAADYTGGSARGVDAEYGTFIMYGGTICGHGTASGAGVQALQTGSEFRMYGGAIKGNTAGTSYYGGGVYVGNGTFTMTGGTISDNKSNRGGGVYMYNSTFTMTDGTISGNTATDGSGVYMQQWECAFTMTGGTISDNKATGYGGGVCEMYGTFTMTGGSITDNTVGCDGGGVYLQGGSSTATFNLSGTPVISGNKNATGTANNVYVYIYGWNGNPIDIAGVLEEGAKIGVTPDPTPTDDPVYIAKFTADMSESDRKSCAEKFIADESIFCTSAALAPDKSYYVAIQPVRHEHYLCGGDECTETGGHSCTTKTEFKAWTSTDSLPTEAGNWYLADDVKLTGKWECVNNVKLCLNGKTITCEDGYDAIEVASGKSLEITDCAATAGKITHESGFGRGISVNGTFTLWNGTITGNTESGSGGGVNVGTSGSFTMYGGSITGNTATTSGGGVNVSANGSFTMNGGSITDNGDEEGKESNVYLPGGTNIIINQKLPENTSIGVTVETLPADGEYVKFAEVKKGVSADEAAGKFTIDNNSNSTYKVQSVDNSLYVINGELHSHAICGENCSHKPKHDNVFWTPLTYNATTQELMYGSKVVPSTVKNKYNLDNKQTTYYTVYQLPAGNYYLADDITLKGDTVTYNGETVESVGGLLDVGTEVKLCLNGKTLTTETPYYGAIDVGANGTLTLSDCKGNGQITSNCNAENGVQIYQGEVTMYGGKITGTKCGVFVHGSFNMYGGTITGNTKGVDAPYDTSIVTVGGTVKITGNSLYNVFLGNTVITIDESLTDKAEIGVSTIRTLPVQIATGASGSLDYTKIFKPDVTGKGYMVTKDGAGLYLNAHEHNWTYKLNDDGTTITASCDAVDCPSNGDGGSVTIKAPAELTYDGNAKAATLAGGFPADVTAPTITYKVKGSDTPIEAPVNAGTYIASITITGADKKSVTASVEYTIEAKELTNPTIKVDDAGIYDGKEKNPGVTVKDGDNLIPAENYDVTYSNNTNAGEATVTVKSRDGRNYSFNSSKTFTIGKATITVTPDVGQSKIYGDSDPVLTYTYSGAVNGEKPAFSGALSREAGEDADDYMINKGTLALTDGKGFIAGNYKLELSSKEINFTINRRPVTVTGIMANDKIYDGTTDVTFDYTNANFEGMLNGDNLTVKVFGAFENKNVGENKKVIYAGMILGGESASNYEFGEGGQTTSKADITPKELTIKDVTVANKTYDGTTEATVTDVTFEGFVDGESSVDYTVSGKFEDATVGTGKSVTATVTLTAGGNYTLPENSRIKTGCEISKATAPTPEVAKLVIINKVSKGYTFALSSILPPLEAPKTYGKCTYQEPAIKIDNSDYDGTAAVSEDGMLTLNITKTGAATAVIGTVTVVARTYNYEDITLTVNIRATDKIIPTLEEGTLTLSPGEITYGDALSKITGISGTMRGDNNEMVSGKFTWADGTIKPAVGDGTYTATWKFTPDDTETYEETTGTVTIKVNKAAQSGTVSMNDYTYNDTPETPKLTGRTVDSSATVTYYYSTTDTNEGGTKWENIDSTTLNAGTYYMYAVIGETANYNAFTTPAVEFEVKQATPNFTKPTGVTAKYGQKLSEITLTNPEGNMDGEWSWQAPDNVFDTIGVSKRYATFKPKDPNYKEVSNIAIEVSVEKGDGKNLATVELKQAFNDSDDHTYTPDWSGLPAGQTWSYGYEPGVSNNITKLEASAENVTYAVSGGKAGDKFTVTLKASCENYEDFTITLNITITKAIPTGAPAYTEITTGDKTLADAKLAVGTLSPADGKLEWIDGEGNVLTNETKVEVNKTYTWRFTPADSDNYESLTGEIELYHVDMPVISSQPTDASVKAGEKAVFEVTATGTDLTYQWQIDRNDGRGFVDLNNATDASYTSGVTDLDCNGFKYQCIISNAAGSVTTETAILTVTEIAPEYKITDGADSSWTQNVNGDLVIRGNGAYADFLKVLVDGTEIDPVNYTAKPGSTIITLKPEFLSTLSEGSHTFEIVWTNGSAGTHFTVARNSSGNNSNDNSNNNSSNDNAGSDNTEDKTVIAPKTGDASKDALMAVLVVVSFAGLAGMLVLKKRNAYK